MKVKRQRKKVSVSVLLKLTVFRPGYNFNLKKRGEEGESARSVRSAVGSFGLPLTMSRCALLFFSNIRNRSETFMEL